MSLASVYPQLAQSPLLAWRSSPVLLYNAGTLTLINSTISGNTAIYFLLSIEH